MTLVLYRVGDATELEALFRRANSCERMTIALRKGEVLGSGGVRLCLFLADSETRTDSDWRSDPKPEVAVVGAGVMRSAGRATTVQTRFAFDPLVMFDYAIDVELVRSSVKFTTDQNRVFDEGLRSRLLSPKTSALVWGALVRLAERDSRRLLALAESLGSFAPASAAEGALLAQERDAVMVATDIFRAEGNPRSRLRLMSRAPSTAPFLARVADSYQLEDQVIGKDARNFLDWVNEETPHAAAMTFRNGRRALTVVNANKTGLEKSTGADLIYYNHESASYVLVQYKMMSHPGKEWVYYPDEQFRLEKARLAQVEAVHKASFFDPTQHLTYRLAQPVTFFKFCRRNAPFEVDDLRLMHGNYVPVEYVDSLMNSTKGPKGAARIVDGTLRTRSLGNSSFSALVSSGLVGTRGTTSEQLNDVIRAGLESGRSLVVGIETLEARTTDP